jgi:hypothetical protein
MGDVGFRRGGDQSIGGGRVGLARAIIPIQPRFDDRTVLRRLVEEGANEGLFHDVLLCPGMGLEYFISDLLLSTRL